MSLPVGIHAKVAAVQRNIKPVELENATGDDAFEFMPAAGVFDEVRRKLRYYKLGYLVEQLVADQPRRARISVTIFDEEDPEDVHGSPITLEWEGEAEPDAKRPLASAATTALKGFWVALFNISAAQRPPENRREARQQGVRERMATEKRR